MHGAALDHVLNYELLSYFNTIYLGHFVFGQSVVILTLRYILCLVYSELIELQLQK